MGMSTPEDLHAGLPQTPHHLVDALSSAPQKADSRPPRTALVLLLSFDRVNVIDVLRKT